MGIANGLNNKPVRAIGFITAATTVVYGFGYVTALGGFTGSVLYVSLKQDIVRQIFGYLLIISGSLLAFAYSRNNPKTVKSISVLQVILWLYAAMIYIINGTPLLALAAALPWALISYYTSFSFKNRVDIIAYDQTPQAKYDTSHEDKLHRK